MKRSGLDDVLGVTWALLLLGVPSGVGCQAWTLADPPILEVGGGTDDLRYALSVVVGGTRLADGRVVVADRIAHGLKMFSESGAFLREVGREGQGPGEYEHIRGIGRCAAGMIVAYDAHWDENRYDEDLELIGTRPASNQALRGTPYESDCNEDGFVLASGWGDFAIQHREGLYSATAPVVLSHDGELVHHFGERLSSERVGGRGGSGPHPFGRQTSVALGPTRAYLGSAEDYSIEVYDLTGRRLPDISWSGPDLTLSADDVAAHAEREVQSVSPASRPRRRRAYLDLPRLDRYPAYDRMLTDRAGNLWVRYFVRPTADTIDWVVFGVGGTKVGEVSLPLRATLLEAGAEYVLVSELDELDVPTVRLYTLVKS